MKKRKIKLFASVASLAMVAAVMGVGVWAATQQSVQVNSTVQFSATAIAANITLQIANGENTANYAEGAKDTGLLGTAKIGEQSYMGTPVQIASWDTNDSTTPETVETIALSIVDSNDDGTVDKGQTITYTFVIDASAAATDVYYNVQLGEDTARISAKVDVATGSITYGAQTKTATVVVTYELLTDVTTTFSAEDIPTIKIGLANTAEAAATQATISA